MAKERQGDIANAFCGIDDITQETGSDYSGYGFPNIGAASDQAEGEANNISLWLETEGHPDQTPATVAEDSIVGKALRKLNAMEAAVTLIQNIPEGNRPPNLPNVVNLETRILNLRQDILGYYKVKAGESARGWGAHTTPGGNTAPQPDPHALEPEDLTTYVTHRKRF